MAFMSEELLPPALQDAEIRKGLIDYYKWIVSLAIFILTISASLVGLFGKDLRFSFLFLIGWILLSICIFFNWLTIKNLVTLPIILKTKKEEGSFIHVLFVATIGNIRAYGLLQNWAFLIGALAIVLGFSLNWLL